MDMKYNNLVIAGGSTKNFATIAVLEELEKRDMCKFKNILGVSSGSIIATLMVMGCSSREMKEIYESMDVGIFDIKWYNPKIYYNLIKNYGINNSSIFREKIIHKILQDKTGNGNITFEELYSKYKTLLVITGSCITDRSTHYYSAKSNPNMAVKRAIEISCCIPLVFTSVKWKGDVLVDGMLINNYPLYFFNDEKNIPNSRNGVVLEQTQLLNKNTLGITFIDDNTSKDGYELYKGDSKSRSLFEFIKNLIKTMFTSSERKYMRNDYWKNTISINVSGFDNNLSFTLNDEQKDFLLEKGTEGCKKFFDKVKL
jgi:NTE family protein